MSAFLVIIEILAGLFMLGVYIYACKKVCEGARNKGHQANPVACFFFGIPYMISIWSKPDLKARPDYTGQFEPTDYAPDMTYTGSTLKPIKLDPKVISAAAAACLVLVGGVFIADKVKEGNIEKKRQTVISEYQAEIDSKKDSVQDTYCKEAGIKTLTYTVSDAVLKPDSKDTFVVTVRIDCTTKNSVSKTVESLVAYELEDAIPSDLKISNGCTAGTYNSITGTDGYGSFMVYSTINGDLVHYPGYLYDGSTFDYYDDYSYDYDYDYDYDYSSKYSSSSKYSYSTSSKYSYSTSSKSSYDYDEYETWIGSQYYNKVTDTYSDVGYDKPMMMLKPSSKVFAYSTLPDDDITTGTYKEDYDGTITFYDDYGDVYAIGVRTKSRDKVVFAFASDSSMRKCIIFDVEDY